MSQNQLISFPNSENKVSVKYNKPHCIIPISDITWIMQQAKAIQTLWHECWSSDPFGSRWEKLATNLTETAFRLARKILYTSGLFEFKRDTCIHDSRKTAGWLVINLHGARRIKDFWNEQIPDINPPTSDINPPTSDINPPTSDINPPTSDIKSTVEIVETPAKSSIPEPLSSISLSPQELLKEAIEKEIPTKHQLLEKAGVLWGKHKEKTAKGLIKIYERAAKYASGHIPNAEEISSGIFEHQYNWRCDDKRLKLLCRLDEDCRVTFFSQFKFVWSSRRMSGSKTFDEAILFVLNNSQSVTEDLRLQVQNFLTEVEQACKKPVNLHNSHPI